MPVRAGMEPAIKTHPKVKVEGDVLLDAQGKALTTLVDRGGSSNVSCFAFSPNGQMLAAGIRYHSVKGAMDGANRGYPRIADTSSVWDSRATLIGPVTHIAFTKNGDCLVYQTVQVLFVGGK